MNIWIHGISGRIGKELEAAIASQPELHLLGGSCNVSPLKELITSANLIIDFSTPDANRQLLEFLQKAKIKNTSILLCTTGLPSELLDQWREFSHYNKVLSAPNTSFGMSTFTQTLVNFTKSLKNSNSYFDIEIIESHHKNKIDTPSGTALSIAQKIQAELPHFKIIHKHEGKRQQNTIAIHSIRGGGIFGEHTVKFIGDHEEINFQHKAFSRQVFVTGALMLAEVLLKKQQQGFYTVFDLLV